MCVHLHKHCIKIGTKETNPETKSGHEQDQTRSIPRLKEGSNQDQTRTSVNAAQTNNSSMKITSKGVIFVVLLCICGISTFWEMSINLSFMQKLNIETGCEKHGKVNQQDEQWFLRHFKRTITPLLTKYHNVSQEEFSWWKRLQSRRPDIDHFKNLTQKIFEIIPAYPPVDEPSQQRCRTCAVVGNSVNLKRTHYGELIDQHESVFRINRGVTKDFEKDVGTKTTHRVIYPESAGARLDNTTRVVFFPFKIRDFEWLIRMLTANTNARYSIKRKDLVMVVNPAFMQYVHLSWLQGKGSYSSTGFMTVILALHLCDEVSVFGFGADSDGNWSHYWELLHDKKLKTGAHPGSVEYDTIDELAKRGKLVFYRGF